MIVVADTSLINYLILIEQIQVLEALYRRVIIPPAVQDELLNPHAPALVRTWMENPPAWLEVRSPVPTFRDSFILGTGESEAIALAEQLGAYRIVMDESLAAQLIAAGKDPSRAALEALAAYQHLLDLIDEPETREGIRRGLADAAAGRTRPAREVSDELRAKYRIPSLH